MYDSTAHLIGARQKAHRLLFDEDGVPKSWPACANEHRTALLELLSAVDEVMILDHGGPALGLVLWASMLKFGLFAALLVRLLLPVPAAGAAVYAAGLAAGLLVVAIAVGIVESSLARLRPVQVREEERAGDAVEGDRRGEQRRHRGSCLASAA